MFIYNLGKHYCNADTGTVAEIRRLKYYHVNNYYELKQLIRLIASLPTDSKLLIR